MEFMVNKQTGERIPTAGITLYADLPVGSWVKNDFTTIPEGFLKSGDAISQTEYPELYEKYGATVPYKADKSELSAPEDATTYSELSTTGFTTNYDGVIYFGSNSSGGSTIAYLTINGTRVLNTGVTSYQGVTAEFNKGDVIKVNNTSSDNYFCKVAYYKNSLIVKAKTTGILVDFGQADSTPTKNSAKVVTSNGVYNFNFRAKDTSISSDWLGPNNISSNWDTFTSVGDFARVLGKRRSVYINFSLGQVQTAIANGVLPSTITSGPGGILHIVTGNSDNGGRGFAFFWCDNTGEVLTATTGDWTSSNWIWRIPGYGTLTGTATPNTSIVSSGVGPVVEWVRSGDMIIVNLRKISFTTNATAAKTLATGLPECGLKRFEGVICGASGHCDIYIDPNTTELKIQYGASGSYGPQMAGQIVYIAKS